MDEPFNFDGSFESWIHIFQNNNILGEGYGVLLFFGGKRILDKYVAGWYFATASARKSEEERVFSSVEYVVPMKLGNRDIWEGLISELREQAIILGAKDEEIQIFLNNQKANFPRSNEGSAIVDILNEVSDGSAVAVPVAQIYRFIELARTPVNLISTWSGEINLTSDEEIFSPHLMELTRKCLYLARQKHLFITLFCEGYSIYDLPSDLEGDPDLAVRFVLMAEEKSLYNITRLFPSWLESLKEEGLEKTLTDIESSNLDPINLALTKARILSADQRFDQAWQEVANLKTFFEEQGDGRLLLHLSQLAASAGKLYEGLSLLTLAINSDIESLEELNSAYILAETLDQEELQQQILSQMIEEYPRSKVTLHLLHLSYLEKRDYEMAIQTAESLGYMYDLEMSKAFSKTDLNLEDFFEFARKENQIERAYVAAAREAEERADYLSARTYASKIQPDSRLITNAMNIRIRILGHLLRESQNIDQNHLNEIINIMEFGATSPKNLEVRFSIEELLESSIEYRYAIAILIEIVRKLIQQSVHYLNPSQKKYTSFEDLINKSLETVDPKAFTEFWRNFLTSLPSKGIQLGVGSLTESQREMLSQDMQNYMLLMLQKMALNLIDLEDYQPAILLLQVIILSGKELGDKSSDLNALRILIGGLAQANYSQESRDLAETFLFNCANLHEDVLNWRISQSWAAMADAFNRSGNNLKALQYLCFCYLCFNGEPLDIELTLSNYRLAARILRDLRLSDYALEMINLEIEARKNTNSFAKQAAVQLRQVKLSTEISQLNAEYTEDEITQLISEAEILVRESDVDELAPSLSCLVSLIRLANLSDFTVSKEVMKTFQSKLELISKPYREIFKIIATGSPLKEEILSIVDEVASASYLDDLTFQTRHLSIIAEDAVKSACLQKDSELFLIASSLLSQPSIALELTQSGKQYFPGNQARAWNWLQSGSANYLVDNAKTMDFNQVFQNIVLTERISIKDLEISKTIEEVRNILLPDESLLFLVHDSSHYLCRMIVSEDEIIGPERISTELWNIYDYHEWATSFPRGYGTWGPPSDPWSEETPSISDVIDSMKDFAIGNFEYTKRCTIIPDAQLFGFPFPLMSFKGEFWGTQTLISTVPSIDWLIRTRKKDNKSLSSRKAWFGSLESSDLTLHWLRDRLIPPLQENGFTIVEKGQPENMSDTDLAILASHGGVGLNDNFKTISDGVRSFSAESFGNSLKGSSCVVLFICHAGRADPKHGNSETVGLVSQLLRAGVSCVVAAPWSLHIYVTELWLPVFLENIGDGKTVGESVQAASCIVRDKYNNPCAWSALQIYGDSSLVMGEGTN